MFLFYVYLYSIVLISLITSYGALGVGLHSGLDLMMGVNTTAAVRQTVANAIGVFVVATPVWLAHWIWLRRSLPDLADPKHALLAWVHRLYLYSVLGLSVLAVVGWGSAAVTSLVAVLIGATNPGPPAVARFGTRFGMLFLSALLWVFHWQDLSNVPPRDLVTVAPPDQTP